MLELEERLRKLFDDDDKHELSLTSLDYNGEIKQRNISYPKKEREKSSKSAADLPASIINTSTTTTTTISPTSLALPSIFHAAAVRQSKTLNIFSPFCFCYKTLNQ